MSIQLKNSTDREEAERSCWQPHGAGPEATAWSLFFREHQKAVKKYGQLIHPAWLRGFARLNLSAERVPGQAALNRALQPTGWQVTPVSGYLSTYRYVSMLSGKKFPVGMICRSPEQAGYSSFPDFIHDVVGHLPMLFESGYCDLIHSLSRKMLAAGPDLLLEKLEQANLRLGELRGNHAGADETKDAEQEVFRLKKLIPENPTMFMALSHFLLWTAEFGLLGTRKNFKVYGAGIMSSVKELSLIGKGQQSIRQLDKSIFSKDYLFTSTQNEYYAAESFKMLEEFTTQCAPEIQE